MPDEHLFLKSKALGALARRDHSRQELQQKLARYSKDQDLIEKVLSEYTEKNWQNDLRFATLYIRSRANRYYGPKKIQYELQQRGVTGADIEQAFAECEIDWKTLAEEARQRKFGEKKAANFAERGKQQQYLYQRGF